MVLSGGQFWKIRYDFGLFWYGSKDFEAIFTLLVRFEILDRFISDLVLRCNRSKILLMININSMEEQL